MTKPGFYPPDFSAQQEMAKESKGDEKKKPSYSYASLIGLAIMNSPDQRARLSTIYTWIASRFRYYQLEQGGWQNSIRHNLTVNKCFVKDGRITDPPGKGSFWAIHPDYKKYFENGIFIKPPKSDEPLSSLASESCVPKIKRRFSSNSIPKKITVRPRRFSEVILPRTLNRFSNDNDETEEEGSLELIGPSSSDEDEYNGYSYDSPVKKKSESGAFFSVFRDLTTTTAENKTPPVFPEYNHDSSDAMETSVDHYMPLNEEEQDFFMYDRDLCASYESLPIGAVSEENLSLIPTSNLTSKATSSLSLNELLREEPLEHRNGILRNDSFLVQPNPVGMKITAGDFEYLRKSILFNSMQFPELSDLFLGYDDSIFVENQQF